MAKRGFFAELQRQAEAAAREQARRARQQEQANNAAMRAAEQARKAQERAVAQQSRANDAEQKRRVKEAREAHIAAMTAEVERQNSELMQMYEAIDSLLPAVLGTDVSVDLAEMRVVAEHPPFDRTDLETPIPAPPAILDAPQPVFTPPPAPKGLLAALGKKGHEKAVAAATASYEQAVGLWRSELARNESARQAAASQHAEAEANRVQALEAERGRYVAECSAREQQAAEHNDAIDKLIANLGYGTADAVEEYVSIVFSKSPYPPRFPVDHDLEFDGASAELRLRVLVPGPDKIPTTSAFKYTKSADEIVASSLSQKACKDRYIGAIHHVALRSLHEVFVADARGLIKTISLEVGTQTIDPATGREVYVPFVAAGVERESFSELDLSNVVPLAALGHLGAAVSKSPFDLIAANASGIRRS
jgi:restriction system protein